MLSLHTHHHNQTPSDSILLPLCVQVCVPWVQQDLVSELENERTNRVIAQQTANQERLQARASAVESASLRRQLNELNQQMEQERRTAVAARLQAQQTKPPRVSGNIPATPPSVVD